MFSLCPVYVIRVLTSLGTMCLIHLLIDLSIVLPLAPANNNIRECIFLSLLVFCKGVSFCAVIDLLLASSLFRILILFFFSTGKLKQRLHNNLKTLNKSYCFH